jgi:hypothetical protein
MLSPFQRLCIFIFGFRAEVLTCDVLYTIASHVECFKTNLLPTFQMNITNKSVLLGTLLIMLTLKIVQGDCFIIQLACYLRKAKLSHKFELNLVSEPK